MPRVTIRDIAKKLSVNPSTISRALRNHPDISVELKEKIKKLAEKMGYKPNYMAINLRSGKSHTIGLIIPDISMFFFPSVIKAIEEEAHTRGYNLLILHSNDSLEREIENSEICAHAGVDGILVSLTKQSLDIEHFQELTYAGVPIVYFDKVLNGAQCHKVVIPGEQAANKAINELLKLREKSKRLCGIFGDKRLSITEDRVGGFSNGLGLEKIILEEKDMLFAVDAEDAALQFEKLWKEKVKPDALFLMSDEILSGILPVLAKFKIKVPEELSIVSISDGYLPRLSGLAIPFVRTSGYTMGKTAAQLLFNLMNGLPITPTTHYIETSFETNIK